jgi:hypothetical protein
MKKSAAIHVPLVTTLAAAALASGCGSSGAQTQGWQSCVDRTQNVAVEQRYCDDESSRWFTPGYAPHYGWYYYPRSYYWDGPLIGSPVPGGGTWGTRPFSAPMARTGAVVRGGLGTTASGHASSSSGS